MMGTPRIAVTVIGGFLGAGKTTLINRWLRDLDGARVMVLVNDFGALNIDAELIAAREGDTLALSNGCICCQMGADLSQALIGVLDRQPAPEELWIEASGVSDPGRIARLVRAAPEFDMRGVMVVVDALSIASQLRDPLLHDTLAAQIQSANCLLMSKTDLVQAHEVAQAEAALRALHPNALVVHTLQGTALAVSPDNPDLFSTAAKSCTPQIGHNRRFTAWTGSPSRTLPVEEWQRRLGALPQQVLRLKGFVRSVEHGWSRVQWAGSRASIEPCDAPQATQASLVAVALRGHLPRQALESLLDA